jgi:cytochrome b subunit of formate dehydrogenase
MRTLQILLFSFFVFFVIHGLLWIVRSLVHTHECGQRKMLTTRPFELIWSGPIERILNAALFFSCLGLVLTGLPLRACRLSPTRDLSDAAAISGWHHLFAVAAMVGCAAYLVNGIIKIIDLRKKNTKWKTILFGPDSYVPTLRDGKDMLNMGRWFFCLGPRPRFERRTYWEKFDYWGICLTVVVIGISGLIRWYPNFFCTTYPGPVLQMAQTVHQEIALLAASYLLVFYFCHTHFRPENFPIDLSALTGMISEEHLRTYRPDYVERLFREGKLDEIRRPARSRQRPWLVFLAGSASLFMGLCLLVLALLATYR